LKVKSELSPAGTLIAPLGAVEGPASMESLPHTLAGGVVGAALMTEGVGDAVGAVPACVGAAGPVADCVFCEPPPPVQAVKTATAVPATAAPRLTRANRR
jgi:hypothetical protein